jgi:hypothetical protein
LSGTRNPGAADAKIATLRGVATPDPDFVSLNPGYELRAGLNGLLKNADPASP